MEADRTCSRCLRTLVADEFPLKRRDGTGRQSYCRDCKAAYQRAWYQRNRERHIRDVRAHRERWAAINREVIHAAKDVPCGDCGARYPPWVMDFDHVRGEKRENVGRMASTDTPAAVRREIAKCEVVCANCHRQRTHDRRHGEPPTASEEFAPYDPRPARPAGFEPAAKSLEGSCSVP